MAATTMQRLILQTVANVKKPPSAVSSNWPHSRLWLRANKARSIYFALECFAKTRTGLVALNVPNHPRLGPLALPRSPESGVEVSMRAKFLSREKTQYVEEFLCMCLYLVVALQLLPNSFALFTNFTPALFI
jgi:hypothetical protein